MLVLNHSLFKYISCILTAFVCCLVLPVSAQKPHFRNFEVKDGLPSSEVYSAMQDSKGYIWFCTDAGVSRYDGYSFKNFSTQHGLPDNTVFGSTEDSKGRIWFRSMSGKLSYYLNDSIYVIGANERITARIMNSIITSLQIDQNDTIWCGVSNNNGFYKIAPPYEAANFQFINPGFSGAFLLEVDKRKGIWGGLDYPKLPIPDTLEVFRLSKNGDRKRVRGPLKILPNSKILFARSDKMILTGENELTISSGDNYIHKLFPTSPISLYEDRDDEIIWAGFYRDGVRIFDKTLTVLNKSHYLEGISVSGIEKDREGGYWFTTIGNGVYYMASNDFLYYDMSENPPNTKALSILSLDTASVLAGLSDGSIYQYGIDTKQKFIHQSITSIYHLGMAKAGLLLVGTRHSYLAPIANNDKTIPVFEEMGSPAIKCSARNQNGDLWAGNYANLYKIDLKTGKTIVQKRAKSRIISMVCDTKGSVWLGCVNGLWEFSSGQFIYWGDRYPLLKNCIQDMCITKDSLWWFATKGAGLIVFDHGKCFQLNAAKGLSSNICKSITKDSNGIIWLGTNMGINRITPLSWGNFKIETFTLDDGLPTNEIEQLTLSGHYIWAATNEGVCFFDTRISSDPKIPPPVYITSCDVNYQKKDFSLLNSLHYTQNFIHINFTGLAYKRGSGLRYKYRLEGLDSTWNYTDATSIQYAPLPPGDYTFKVYALHVNGLESIHPAILHFHIDKPFWLRLWFILTYSTLGFLLIYFIYNQRLKAIKKRLLKEEIITRKISEIELKALRAQMNPHFIFNCIASIQNFILKSDTESANKYLSKFSRLIRLVLTNSTHEYISLEIELETLGLYLELESMRFREKFSYVFRVHPDIDPGKILIAPLILQPYVENAIWHGLMHLSERKGELLITLGKSGDVLKCCIEDNGIGRKKSLESKQGSKHKSFGLSITRERLENINAIYKSKLSVNFIDKHDQQGVASGTIVEIFIPLSIRENGTNSL